MQVGWNDAFGETGGGLDTPTPRWYEPPAPSECALKFRPCFRCFGDGLEVVPSMLLELVAATAASTLEGATRAMAGGVPLDFDRSVLLQIVVFTALIVVLKPLLFAPMLKVFALREERTEGARATARELQEKAGELLRRYEKELERVQEVATAERELLRSETAKLEAEILHEGREMTTRIVEEGRRKIEHEVNSIRVAVGAESERVAQMIVDRVVGQGVN